MSDPVEINTRALDQFMKALKDNSIRAHVGILGDKNSRPKGGAQGNAEIGARHEFGTDKLPMRSFLRIPITENMQTYLDKAGFFDEEALKKVIAEGSFVPWTEKIAIVAESIVLDGFATGGFGKWKPSNMARKKVQQTLVETQQLRNSITWDVKK